MLIPPQLLEQLKQDEGLRLAAYWDPIGKVWTCGYGSTGPNVTENTVWTQAQADAHLVADATHAGLELNDQLPWTQDLGEVRHAVFWNMTFNMGIGNLMGFHATLGAAQAGRFDECAAQMLNSLWASQVGARAQRLAQQMRTNQWVMASG